MKIKSVKSHCECTWLELRFDVVDEHPVFVLLSLPKPLRKQLVRALGRSAVPRKLKLVAHLKAL